MFNECFIAMFIECFIYLTSQRKIYVPDRQIKLFCIVLYCIVLHPDCKISHIVELVMRCFLAQRDTNWMILLLLRCSLNWMMNSTHLVAVRRCHDDDFKQLPLDNRQTPLSLFTAPRPGLQGIPYNAALVKTRIEMQGTVGLHFRAIAQVDRKAASQYNVYHIISLTHSTHTNICQWKYILQFQEDTMLFFKV